ncbi:MAG: putative S-layer associated protein [Symbiobacteriaceae bacterium]|jgi:uncharacterized protein YkwD|nr:putative S-layer associated protein [Symbiobacteriaceae bacterium]
MDRKTRHHAEYMEVSHEDIGVKYVTRVIKPVRSAALLLVLALLLLATQPAGADPGYVPYRQPSPQGTIGLSRPTIQMQFYLGIGEVIRAAHMRLDGADVTPKWDAEGLISYTPPAALAEGEHTVHLTVDIASVIAGWTYDTLVRNFSFTVAQGAIVLPPQPRPEELRALERVNAYRKAAGQSPLNYDNSLGAAAAGHARYLVQNPDQTAINAHGQTVGTPLFFGATPGARVNFFAYGGGVQEIIAFAGRAEDAVDEWMATLYHRLPIIYPGNTEMGYGLAGQGTEIVNVLEAGPALAGGGAVVWPYPGQEDVPTAWDGLEMPDPFRLYPGVVGPVGYTVTLTFGGAVRSLMLNQWSLTGPNGAVSAMTFSPENDGELTDTVALIPVAPLEPGASYEVTMAGQVDVGQGLQPYTRTWSFTTAPDQVPDFARRWTTRIGSMLRDVTVSGSGFAPSMRVYLGGLEVENLQVESSGQFSFEPPPGLPAAAAHDLVVVTAGGREARWPEFLAEGQFTLPAGSPFSNLPMVVHGEALALPAKLHASGQVLIPASALEHLGAMFAHVPELGRSYWLWGGRNGDYTMGSVAAQVEGLPMSLALPVQRLGGETYIDQAWVSRLLGDPVRLAGGQVQIGMQDIAGHWARPLIIQLLRDGVVSGAGSGWFGPNDPLTRAAFVKMLVGARRVPVRPGNAGRFADTAGHWVAAQGYIGAAVEAGFVVPLEYPGGRFEPDLPISREEMAVMVTRALGLDTSARSLTLDLAEGTATVAGRPFADAADWTRPGYIAVAVEQGIINGYPADGGFYAFHPFRQATRAEAVAMIVRMADK